MKQGERPPKGVKLLVVRLAGRDPRPTNAVIEEVVKEKFGVNLDSKTIRRYCKEAGLPTSNQTARGVAGGWRPPSAVWAADAVYQQARLNHVRRLSEVAEQLEGQLYLPLPGDASSWVPPQGYLHRVLAICSGSHPLGLRPNYCWEPQEADPGVIHLGVEGDLYFPCLRGHIADNQVWTLFQDWKTTGAVYLSACHQLAQAIVKECEGRTGSRILIDEDWPQEGVYWYFAKRVYAHHTNLAQGYPGVGRIVYELKEEPQEQGIIPTLWHGDSRIACHQDREFLTEWQGVHQKLLVGDDWKANAEALVREHEKLDEIAKSIRQVLRLEIERGTFDRGRCQLCPDGAV